MSGMNCKLERLVGRSTTVCDKCAREHGLRDLCLQSDLCVFAGCGPDSVCDVCGKENGGTVVTIPPNVEVNGR